MLGETIHSLGNLTFHELVMNICQINGENDSNPRDILASMKIY